MMNILLVEPAYKNKYPPMGLMKISTYHKMRGDNVTFVKGKDETKSDYIWDRIYITTLFTFDFQISVDTINYYKAFVSTCDDLFVGGIMASLMKDKVKEATGLLDKNILVGLLTDSYVLGDDAHVNVDTLPLDYDILDMIEYSYPAGDNYFAYTTRGCPNHCSFCAVPIWEPNFTITNNIKGQLSTIDEEYGAKQNLLLLDNNILNAPCLSAIVNDLCEAGFAKGASFVDPGHYDVIMKRYHRGDRGAHLDKKLRLYLNTLKKRIPSGEKREQYLSLLIESEEQESFADYMIDIEHLLRPLIDKYKSKSRKMRCVDFNQGVDARRINDENMALLGKLAIRPLRIAFDDIKLEEKYCHAVRLAHKHGITEISNYILFNYKDRPEDLYRRLECNIVLNQELGIRIFSFPMKYTPVDRIDRSFIGQKWNAKYLSAISAILHVTQGVVAAGTSFFYKAFGKDVREFYEILAMPRDLIMNRFYYEGTGQADEWKLLFNALSSTEKDDLLKIVSHSINEIKQMNIPSCYNDIIPYYYLKHKKDKVENDECE